MKLFRRPLWRDWCFWLGVVGVLVGIAGARQQAGDYKALGAAIVYAGAIVVQWFLFGVLPASARRTIRSWRKGEASGEP